MRGTHLEAGVPDAETRPQGWRLRFFLRGACLEGLAEPTPKELCGAHTKGIVSPHQRNCVYTTPLVWVESTGIVFRAWLGDLGTQFGR